VTSWPSPTPIRGGKARLLVYGVDEHQHVYWYHPAWPPSAAPPVPLVDAAGVGPHELPEAIRHPLDGRRLQIVALLFDRPLSVDEVERALLGADGLEALARRMDASLVQRFFTVTP